MIMNISGKKKVKKAAIGLRQKARFSYPTWRMDSARPLMPLPPGPLRW